VPRHYIVRTSWVIGDGPNFVRTMRDLCARGVRPAVVSDQVGRLSFAADLAAAALHLLDSEAPYGVYNVSNGGDAVSWAEIAEEVFVRVGGERAAVQRVSTDDYFAGRSDVAPRPALSTFDLAKIRATGFEVPDWRARLDAYLRD
jgi:dTDP-4-dehydrorhamnose 3,5-epimerase